MLAQIDTFSFELDLAKQGYDLVAGVDEAGRGPLAGPVVAASVILPSDCKYEQFKDSKKLSPKAREKLYAELGNMRNVMIGVGVVSLSRGPMRSRDSSSAVCGGWSASARS